MQKNPEKLKGKIDPGSFLDTIAIRLFSIIKIIIFLILLLVIIFIFIEIYTPKGIVILPFEIKNENLSGIAIADMITSELLRIQSIHNIEYKARTQVRAVTSFEAKFSADSSASTPLVPKTEIMEFSMADTGTIGTSYGSLDPGKIIRAIKNICPGRKPDNTIRGSLLKYGSFISLVAVFEGDALQSWTVREPVDNNNEKQLHEMIRNLTFMIAHDLPHSYVSARSWDSLKYYTEAVDAYNQYELTKSLDAINRSGEELLKAIRCEKGYAKAYDLLRALEFEYIRIQEPRMAMELCNKTIEIDPTSEFGWENRANVLHITNRINESIHDYNNAIMINPQYAEAWNDIGTALEDQNQSGAHENGIEAYDQAIRINPRYKEAWNNKGLALSALGKNDEAIKTYEKAIEIEPNYAIAWYNKGLSLKALKKYDESIIAFNKAIRLNPDYAKAWYSKGLALNLQHKYDDAIMAFDEAIVINPKYAKAWYNKGVALNASNRTEEANKAFSKARELGYSA